MMIFTIKIKTIKCKLIMININLNTANPINVIPATTIIVMIDTEIIDNTNITKILKMINIEIPTMKEITSITNKLIIGSFEIVMNKEVG
jgi:hypothetical protein